MQVVPGASGAVAAREWAGANGAQFGALRILRVTTSLVAALPHALRARLSLDEDEDVARVPENAAAAISRAAAAHALVGDCVHATVAAAGVELARASPTFVAALDSVLPPTAVPQLLARNRADRDACVADAAHLTLGVLLSAGGHDGHDGAADAGASEAEGAAHACDTLRTEAGAALKRLEGTAAAYRAALVAGGVARLACAEAQRWCAELANREAAAAAVREVVRVADGAATAAHAAAAALRREASGVAAALHGRAAVDKASVYPRFRAVADAWLAGRAAAAAGGRAVDAFARLQPLLPSAAVPCTLLRDRGDAVASAAATEGLADSDALDAIAAAVRSVAPPRAGTAATEATAADDAAVGDIGTGGVAFGGYCPVALVAGAALAAARAPAPVPPEAAPPFLGPLVRGRVPVPVPVRPTVTGGAGADAAGGVSVSAAGCSAAQCSSDAAARLFADHGPWITALLSGVAREHPSVAALLASPRATTHRGGASTTTASTSTSRQHDVGVGSDAAWAAASGSGSGLGSGGDALVTGAAVPSARPRGSVADGATETPTHFPTAAEPPPAAGSSSWNEWALRRDALRAVRLLGCATTGVQTDASAFRRDDGTQVRLPADAGTQTAADAATQPERPFRVLTGARGVREPAVDAHTERLRALGIMPPAAATTGAGGGVAAQGGAAEARGADSGAGAAPPVPGEVRHTLQA